MHILKKYQPVRFEIIVGAVSHRTMRNVIKHFVNSK